MTSLKTIIIICLTSLLLCACNNSPRQAATVSTSEDATSPTNTVLHPAEADTITLNIQNGKATARIYKVADQHINIKFNAGDFTRMTGTVTSPDSTANIRFSQILMPDGQMDGPFGRDISYNLDKRGNYVLFLHENQMAGDPWAGEIIVGLSLSR